MFDREKLSDADERVLDRFLGVEVPPRSEDEHVAGLRINAGWLVVTGSNLHIAWFDTGGALWGMTNTRLHVYDSVHYLSALAQRLGLPALERTSFEPSPIETTGAWTLGDQVIKLGEPFLLCGPMGVQAYRATRMVR